MIDSLFLCFFSFRFFLVAIVGPRWRGTEGEFQSLEDLIDSSGVDPREDDWSMRDFSRCELPVEV